ncbi:hypothetical protein N865_15890 [Intrasporangium oryzae NRRL B-24470]|uniref:SRPBCC family protein n=1 Tax=Intrasporangium oryzae NRRL B-24470 TaxID=1386089 RepID=W9G958_9MICO|nr:hypothetical protein [Intrasporangium oryzae]EWT00399.1 hypothetical protein N865_15890 [Intrasporangium oryzae NRRL B-24470]
MLRVPGLIKAGALVGGVAAAGLSVWTLRWSAMRWGATTGETTEPLPGDQVLPDARLVATRAITIDAPPDRVWPWVVQIGQGRAGFYSYDALENLVGCDIHSATRIVESWQHLEVGDRVRLHPQVALEVASVDPGHSLVLHAGAAMAGSAGGSAGAAAPSVPYDFTWAFVVRRHPGLTTRLIVRERYAYVSPASVILIESVSAASAVMSRKMLRGIRDRAERAMHPGSAMVL